VKLPQFRLRILFVLIAMISIPMAWVAYQLNWIRDRHSFFQKEQPDGAPIGQGFQPPNAPWSLRLFGECGVKELWAFKEDKERATRLFPEAKILIWKAPHFDNPSRDYSLIGPDR
jgi:hypothetical protein